MRLELIEKVNSLPSRPGVYFFKDEKGEILYIGKAKDLKKRVRSYFLGVKDTKTSVMLSKVVDVEHIVTHTEKEALILEDALVKQHKPRYNIKLKDDKNYPFVRLSLEEKFPALEVVRRPKQDSALYLGPFPSSQSLKETLKVIGRVFPLRKCKGDRFGFRSRPCINYQMGRCLGPCCLPVDEAQYREIVEQVRRFFEGEGEALVRELERKMHEEAQALRFEEASVLRDRVFALRRVLERQKVLSLDRRDRDVIALERDQEKVRVFVLSVRGGKLLSGRTFEFKEVGLPEEEVLSSFISRYYGTVKVVPEVIIPWELEDATFWEAVGIDVHPPRDDKERGLLAMAYENLRSGLLRDKEAVLLELKRRLRLGKTPLRIEAFDLSNLGGREAVGSMVVFLNGEPLKAGYRRFKIREVKEVDDYSMLEEVLKRRFTRAKQEEVYPDLLVVDGGRGHLKVALKVLREEGINNVDCIAIAKAREGEKEDKVYLPNVRDPIPLKEGRTWAQLIRAIRDEAHRFALSYHRKLREKEAFEDPLVRIPGVGEKRKRLLLERFGGLEGLKRASLEEIKAVPGIGDRLAEQIYSYLKDL